MKQKQDISNLFGYLNNIWFTLILKGQFNGYLAIPMEIWNKIKLESDPDRIYETNYDLVPDIGIMAHGWWTYGEQFDDFSTDDAFIPMLDIRKVDTTNYMIIGPLKLFENIHLNYMMLL